MSTYLYERPQRVAPAPEVLEAIRNQLDSRNLSPRDRRLPSVERELAIEPVNVPGLNEGIFYPPQQLPPGVSAVGPSEQARRRPTVGTLTCLVLLVDFDDNPGNRDPQTFSDMLFSFGTYTTGSMRDFYWENSYKKLEVTGKVVGWLRMPQPYAYYVAGQSGTGEYPNNAQKLTEDALVIAADMIDFRDFDTDGDGFLDGLFIIHAGGGAEAEPDPQLRANMIWSHQWSITAPFVSNGITAYSYFTAPEDGRVGVFCHEFGHMLGLPDLYDTTYQSEGVGRWCVMGAGSWNNHGDTPAHFCLWAKARLGWIEPVVIQRARTLKLQPIEQREQGYRLWTRGRNGLEYFLIENRQQVGFDQALPGAGLLIWHIDDSEHNNDHPGDYWVGVKQADGSLDLEFSRNRGDTGDPFPGSHNNTSFDDTTNPAARDQFGNPTDVSVTNITIQHGVVSCRVTV